MNADIRDRLYFHGNSVTSLGLTLNFVEMQYFSTRPKYQLRPLFRLPVFGSGTSGMRGGSKTWCILAQCQNKKACKISGTPHAPFASYEPVRSSANIWRRADRVANYFDVRRAVWRFSLGACATPNYWEFRDETLRVGSLASSDGVCEIWARSEVVKFWPKFYFRNLRKLLRGITQAFSWKFCAHCHVPACSRMPRTSLHRSHLS